MNNDITQTDKGFHVEDIHGPLSVDALEGAELDLAVAEKLGGKVATFNIGTTGKTFEALVPTSNFPDLHDYGMSFSRLHMNFKTMDGADYSFHPSTDWSQGGPIIEEYEISIIYHNSAYMMAVVGQTCEWVYGPTPLIAAMRAFVASKIDNKSLKVDKDKCKKCGGKMKKGVAIQETVVTGAPDFPGMDTDSRGQTVSAGGPGKLVSAIKCERCGWSITK